LIDSCFIHCSGIGPETDRKIRKAGFNSWDECIFSGNEIPIGTKRLDGFLRELRQSIEAYNKNDLEYLISAFPPREHWRILGEYFSKATFFDIETTGLSWHYSHASVICAYHRGEIRTFVYGKDLDDFLDLLEDCELLVSFNGNSFDVPFIEKTFNIPSIDCPHIDLRWIAYHLGYKGGLKSIEKQLGFKRPTEIADIDGFEAVDLFYRWQDGDEKALYSLSSYCRADVLATYLVAARLMNVAGFSVNEPDADDFLRRALL